MTDALQGEGWTDIGGVRTRYFVQGEGEVVLLIHGSEIGAPESSAVDWRECFTPLSRTFRVIAFDRLGMGYTGPPQRDEDYTLAASSAHARQFIEALADRPVHIVAHGSGARIALDLCLGGTIRVLSCVLLNSATVTPGVTEIVPRPTWSNVWEPERQLQEHFRALCASHYRVPTAIIAETQSLYALESLAQVRRNMRDAGLRTRVYLRELGASRAALFRRIKETGISVPMLLLNGADDPLVTDECAAMLLSALAEKQREVELHLIARCGHYPQLEAPEHVVDHVSSFVATFS
jgi:2-hydroxy-6-oxonona-2,4-dienedioate hydrolase